MAARVDSLPVDFVPFAELNVCGNLMRGGKAPFVFGEIVPLLVGKNTHAKLWLSAPKDTTASAWIDLIAGGEALHNEVKILLSEDQRVTSVQFRGQPVLELRLPSSDSAELPFLDLRPIGLNIFGENDVLNVGPHTLSNNLFNNVAYMAKLGRSS